MEIIYEDNHLIAVNKPAGILVHGDKTHDSSLSDRVKAYIKDRYGKPGDVFLGVIHRLDRPVSGVTIFARTSKALERMNHLFADRQVEKTYWAITSRRPDPIIGHLTHYILKDKDLNVSKAFDTQSNRSKDAKQADLDYNLIGELGTNYLLEVKPVTGRPHQIRAQLSKIGCPIKGDVKYRSEEKSKDGSIYLHCQSLRFIHPVNKEMVVISAETPDGQIWDLFRGIDS